MHKLLFCHALPPSCKVIKPTSIWMHHILPFSASAQKKLKVYAIKNIGPLWNFTKHLHPNFPEPYRVPAPEPSKTSPAICAGTHRNLNTVSAPEPSGTSPASCTETLQNLNRYLHRNPPEPEPSRTSPGICTGTLRNLNRYLHPPEPSGTLPGTWCWSYAGSHQS